jgi:mannonate dehydratase
MVGLAGAYTRYSIDGLQKALGEYQGISRANYALISLTSLRKSFPTADELGMHMCLHPDDPPLEILDQHDSLTNGLTLCSGSFGANPANDLPEIPSRFADRIHFTHLRNIRREPDGSFKEAAHLDGDTDMVGLVKFLLD